MNKSPNRFRLPLQKLPFMADWRIKRRLKAAMKQQRQEGVHDWGHFFGPRYAYATLTMAVLVLAIGGYQWLPGYVYESETIVRGDYLYDWKRSQEKTHLATLTTPAQKADFYMTLSDKRLAEAQTLVGRSNRSVFPTAKAATPKTIPKVKKIQVSPQDSLVAGLITESGVFLGQSIEETGKVKDTKVAEDLLKKIETRLKQQKTELTKINQQIDEPEVEASIPVLIAQADAHEKLIARAEQLIVEESFIPHFESRGFGFQPIELEILADEISAENQVLVHIYDEMDHLEDQYFAFEDQLNGTSDPIAAMQIEDQMDAIEDQMDVLDDVAEEQEERIEDMAEDLDDVYEGHIEIIDYHDLDPHMWADGWYVHHWEEYIEEEDFPWDDDDHEDYDDEPWEEDDWDDHVIDVIEDIPEAIEERIEDFGGRLEILEPIVEIFEPEYEQDEEEFKYYPEDDFYEPKISSFDEDEDWEEYEPEFEEDEFDPIPEPEFYEPEYEDDLEWEEEEFDPEYEEFGPTLEEEYEDYYDENFEE